MTVPCGAAMLLYRSSMTLPSGVVIPNDLLIGRRKGSHGEGEYSVPGGRVEPNEDPLHTAYRETLEETGISVVPQYFRPVPFVNALAGNQHWVTLFFIAEVPEGIHPKLMEPDKCEGWSWWRFNVLPGPLFGPLAEMVKRLDDYVGVETNYL